MFSTCIVCHAPLGSNASIEHFPVGTRLAFDAERGRLWAICPRCRRWNLAPIEGRWEALEECERAYRGASQRVSTDNIALARLKDGTDLVRIGRPLLPEFAAWRYGRELRQRARRTLAVVTATSGVATLANIGKIAGGAAFSVSGAGFALAAVGLGGEIAMAAWMLRRRLPMVALREEEGRLWGVSGDEIWLARFGRTDDGRLRMTVRDRLLRSPSGLSRLLRARYAWDRSSAIEARPRDVVGDEALRLLRLALPVAQRDGGSRAEVREAVALVETTLGARNEPADAKIAAWLADGTGARPITYDQARGRPLNLIPAPLRLAAEIALHEDDERRALAGELGALYARWEEAERIARIADGELARLMSSQGADEPDAPPG